MPKPRTVKVVLTLNVEKGEDVKAKELAKRANRFGKLLRFKWGDIDDYIKKSRQEKKSA